jgi:hypothetical protein
MTSKAGPTLKIEGGAPSALLRFSGLGGELVNFFVL